MKKFVTLLLALVATTALWAENFSAGGIYYNILTDKTNEVEVTSSGSSSNEYSGSVTIPATVTYSGKTYNVTSIGEYAFKGCSALTSVTIPNSVTSIGDFAFYNCTGLTSISIPNSVTSIGRYAFGYCSGLTSITIPNSVTEIGGGAFYKCSGLTSVTIGNSVTSIGNDAFNYCTGLTSVTIGNSVTSIGRYAFGFCYGLTSITIPNSVTEIGEYAFYNCTGLTSVTIGNSVTSIGRGAFMYFESLKEVICYAEKVPQMGERVFNYTPQSAATLYVLADALVDYKIAEQWKKFGTILPIQETDTDLENIHSQSPMANRQKVIRDGQLIILRDGKTYNAMGQEL